MRNRIFAAAGAAVLFGLGLLTLAGCGGGSVNTGGGGGGGTTTPTVTVSANPSTITTAQGTMVTVALNGTSGAPTGTVTLTSGTYNSGAVTLSGGSAQIMIAAGKLANGMNTLTATYNSGSSSYNNSSGTGSVMVSASALITPTVTVSPNPSNITTAQSTTVTVTVSGASGTPTGSVTLTSGSYSSGAVTLTSGSTQIAIPAGRLATGNNVTLTAGYTPDANSSSTYNSASGTGSVNVTAPSLITPAITVSPSPSSITPAQNTTVTVTVNGGGGNPTPTGSVKLTSGSYSSSTVSLVSGSAQIAVQGSLLAVGSDTLSTSYTPDSNSSSTYDSASGTGSVTVTSATLTTPTIAVSPNPSTISSTASTTVTATVSGIGGTPTGSVTLTSGTYNSGAVTLSGGSAQIVVQGSALAIGNNVLMTARYTPDANSSSVYNSTTGTAIVTVTLNLAITSFTANPNPIPPGSSSTQLTADFSGGTGVITPGANGSTGSIHITSGTPVTVSPATTTVFTLTVTPTSGSPITQMLTVNVQSAAVTVNPANTGIAVTNQIMGLNMAVWYDFTANTSTILNSFKNAGIVALRWPGGSTSDDYHWNGGNTTNPGIGVPPTPSTCQGQYQNPTTNYLNFINDLESAITNGFDVALTANYGTNASCTGGGNPQEAANWVAYAYANGGKVSHVTVGNEEYGTWEEDMHNPAHDPTTYAASVAGTSGYYDLIKAQSSSTQVGVVVDAHNGCCTADWDSTVLSNAKGYYDFVEFHYYAQDPPAENDTYLVQQAAQAFTTQVNTIKSELSTAGETGTPIFVGEIGSVSSAPGKQSVSITQGLYAGQLLGEMMNDGIARATWWIGFGNCDSQLGNDSSSLYGWQTFGAYNVFSDGSADLGCPNYGSLGTMSPTAIAYELFSNLAVNGEHVLTPAVTGDTTDVRAYAATNPNGTAIVLFNLNETTEQSVVLNVTGESNSPGITEYSYDKMMYDYTNTACQTDQPLCSYDATHNYASIDWVGPATTSLGAQALPLTVTLEPWSMNVFIIQ